MPFQSSPRHQASPLISGSTDLQEYMANLFLLMSVSVTRSVAARAEGKFSTFLLSQRGLQDEVGGLRACQKKQNKP